LNNELSPKLKIQNFKIKKKVIFAIFQFLEMKKKIVKPSDCYAWFSECNNEIKEG
jgi:hypothetical protein